MFNSFTIFMAILFFSVIGIYGLFIEKRLNEKQKNWAGVIIFLILVGIVMTTISTYNG